MPLQPDGKKRQSSPKVRTGCITCKVRRVKCDEAKPECNRCLKTGRKCDGYAINTTVSNTQAIAVRTLPALIPGSSQEKRAFQYFVTQTAKELSGFYSSSFWDNLILQVSASDPALRHVVIALGTIHEEFQGKRLCYFSDTDAISEGMSFSIKQYAKAISHLRKSLATGKQSPVSALMSCILFVAFDSLRGYFDSAMLHLQSGLTILGELKGLSKEDANFIQNDLVPLFIRQCVQAILYYDTRSPEHKQLYVAKLAAISTKVTKKFDNFETLEEAREGLLRAADSLFRWFYISDPELPMGCQTEGIYPQFLERAERISLWHDAFVKFMAKNSATMSSRQVRGAALLKIQHSIIKMMASTIPKPDDPRKLGDAANDPDFFSWLNNDFQAVVNMARSLIVAAEQDAKAGQPPLTFSSDLGVIGPLYYVCVRCVDKQIKQAALDLLDRCQRREGMWDSEAAVKMIREYWVIEEQHRQSQLAFADEPGMRIPITEVVELKLGDGMRWDWKWKQPYSGVATPSQSDTESSGMTDYDMFPPDFWLYGSTSESDSRFSEFASIYSGEES